MLQAADGTIWIGGGEHPLLHYRNGKFHGVRIRLSVCAVWHRTVRAQSGGLREVTRNVYAVPFWDKPPCALRGECRPTRALSGVVLDNDNSLWIGTMGSASATIRMVR
jgi:hypothetical protein